MHCINKEQQARPPTAPVTSTSRFWNTRAISVTHQHNRDRCCVHARIKYARASLVSPGYTSSRARPCIHLTLASFTLHGHGDRAWIYPSPSVARRPSVNDTCLEPRKSSIRFALLITANQITPARVILTRIRGRARENREEIRGGWFSTWCKLGG